MKDISLRIAGSYSVRRGEGSLRHRVNRLLVTGLGVLLLLIILTTGTALVAAVFGLRAVQARGAEPAAAELLGGMTDQQSGLLIYLNSGRSGALVLYLGGQQETEDALRELRSSAAGTAEAEQAARVDAAATDWERWADDLRLRVVPSPVRLVDPTAIDQGRRLFAHFRAAQQELVSQLEADSSRALGITTFVNWLKDLVVVIGAAVIAILLRVSVRSFVREGFGPLRELADAAGQIALEGRTSIPHVDSGGEVGELARALQGWQDAASVRAILSEQAPIGVCGIDAQGRFLTANAALQTMLGYPRDQLLGQALWAFMHPGDVGGAREGHRALMDGKITRYRGENRWHRSDGTVVWCSMFAAPVPGMHGRPETLVGTLEDITGRKRQVERAVRIQRELLPKERPLLEGYDLAGACIPAQDVGGDFYDWVGPQGGQLDLTVADVMGKGMGAALVMATLRAALRSAPHELSPGARVGLASESLSHGLTDDGLFVTLFHARLDVETGVLRYVDAGHGHCMVRRADGEVVRLMSKSLPVGVLNDAVYEEGQVTMEPGDTLLAYTDGLVEIGDQTLGPGELTGELGGTESAEETVGRLVSRVRGQQGDDVTVVLLRRTDPRPAVRSPLRQGTRTTAP